MGNTIKRSDISEEDVFKNVRDSAVKTQKEIDELNQELDEAIKKATDVINDYTQWLETEQIPRATHDWVIGAQKFARLVDVRKIGKSPAEILEIGEKMLKETTFI